MSKSSKSPGFCLCGLVGGGVVVCDDDVMAIRMAPVMSVAAAKSWWGVAFSGSRRLLFG